MAEPDPNELEVSLFGPGYGECVVVHLGRGEWLVVDSCVDHDRKAVALKYLAYLGLDPALSIKFIVSTHWHDDHVRGLSQVVEAAPNAKLFVSGAIGEHQFLRLVAAMKSAAGLPETGVDEWSRILTLFQVRRASGCDARPSCLVGDRRIHHRPSDNTGIPACELWSLSPSDESYFEARAGFESLFPKSGQTPTQLVAKRPNHTSVALLVGLGDAYALLGADLEHVSSPNSGWAAVVNSTARPRDLAAVFKIPHHGSANGHNQTVWEKMLSPSPISIISPFVSGKTVLPTLSDLSRIKGLSSECYATTDAREVKSRRKRAKLADRTMLAIAQNVSDVPSGTGHIQLRKRPGAEWTASTFGSAIKV